MQPAFSTADHFSLWLLVQKISRKYWAICGRLLQLAGGVSYKPRVAPGPAFNVLAGLAVSYGPAKGYLRTNLLMLAPTTSIF
jgi:hypothetical protein